jgi:hypothetical protein
MGLEYLIVRSHSRVWSEEVVGNKKCVSVGAGTRTTLDNVVRKKNNTGHTASNGTEIVVAKGKKRKIHQA